jgi:hypothetical protein
VKALLATKVVRCKLLRIARGALLQRLSAALARLQHVTERDTLEITDMLFDFVLTAASGTALQEK